MPHDIDDESEPRPGAARGATPRSGRGPLRSGANHHPPQRSISNEGKRAIRFLSGPRIQLQEPSDDDEGDGDDQRPATPQRLGDQLEAFQVADAERCTARASDDDESGDGEPAVLGSEPTAGVTAVTARSGPVPGPGRDFGHA